MWPVIPDGVEPALYYLCIGSAVLIVGIAKAGFGGGIGVLAPPLMAIVLPFEPMLGLLLPILILADILSNLHYLGDYEWRLLKWLLPGAVSGVIVGTGVLMIIQQQDQSAINQTLSFVIGGVCLAVVLMQAYRLTGRELPTLPPHPASSWSIGMLAGGVSTIAHAAGPIVTIYLLQERVPKRRLMGTILLYFLLINSAKVPTYVTRGLITMDTLRDTIWLLPLLPIGTLMGAWMNSRIPEKPFAATLYVLAALGAAWLIIKPLMG